ncbi:reverse transcriptase [Caerostris darwini]|uniref:Reverse transcriptase n=1 Tax=Caerostris darwini TaxID=1538125 RepID=A0AAV4Q7X2_9ARAC|nr:reverse transcriptase [Caerostris darwini]
MGWILRFINNIKKRVNERTFCNLNVEECDKAEKIILRKVQRECFEKNRNFSMQTYLDPDDLLRVTTRIIQRKDQESFRYPILLPSKHHIVDKLIFEKHVELCHAGIQVLMSTLREEYWIIKSRKTIRQVIRNCLRCKRFSIHSRQSISAPLPEDRIREAQVFEVIGVDLAEMELEGAEGNEPFQIALEVPLKSSNEISYIEKEKIRCQEITTIQTDIKMLETQLALTMTGTE